MSDKLKRLRKRKRELTKWKDRPKLIIPRDTVRFCREILRYKPFSYGEPLLRDRSHFVAWKWPRQTGKTFNGMAKLIHFAVEAPNRRIIITAPSFDQVKNIAFFHLNRHINRMRPEVKDVLIAPKGDLKTIKRFRNHTEVLAEAPEPDTIRGHPADLVYIMEHNFVREDEDLYTGVLFMLAATNGFLWAESTCWNTDAVFYKIFNDPKFKDFSRHSIIYEDALAPKGPLTLEIVEAIKKQLAGNPARWKREMMVEWSEDIDVWLPTSLITLAQDSRLSYVPFDATPTGHFYIGADFGKEHYHSVVAVIDVRDNDKYLVHCHQFPLGTSYGSVIGYIKKIQDNWRTVYAVYPDKTGLGAYIEEDMIRGGIHNVTGINFTVDSKEQIATALKEEMRRAVCPICGKETLVEISEGKWDINCPHGCVTSEGNQAKLRPYLHIPYDQALLDELNVEKYEIAKTGKILFSHPEGIVDDRFWALGLSVLAASHAEQPSRLVRAY